MRKIVFVMFALSVIAACTSPQQKPKKDTAQAGALKQVKISEVIQAQSYTYLKVTDALAENWLAVAKQDYTVGADLFVNFTTAVTMENFHSKELNRDFPSILFVSQVSNQQEVPSSQPMGGMGAMGGQNPMGKKAAPIQANVKIEPIAGGVTIAELYANKAKYAGKKVKIKGSVVKVNDEIMGKNWVHLQDGTKNGDDFDLTFTTKATVLVNDVVIFEGVVAIDKDFTAGYVYPLIVEDAELIK
ncbi:MAG: hypothetical protein WCP85_21335 [Mariniphaga sp.]